MKSSHFQRLLRTLVTLLGTGIGAAVAAVVLRALRLFMPEAQVSPLLISGVYSGSCLIFGAIFFAWRYRLVARWSDAESTVEQTLIGMSVSHLLASMAGLMVGLALVALISPVLSLLGGGLVTVVTSIILYMVAGTLGWNIGRRRGKDIISFLTHPLEHREKSINRRHGAEGKVLDTSVLIDGRVLDIFRLGFLEGDIILHTAVTEELQRLADSADDTKHQRGVRGLSLLEQIKATPGLTMKTDDTTFPDSPDTDVCLVRLCRQKGYALLTGDYNLQKMGQVVGVKVLNPHDLAQVMRQVVIAGETLPVTITKEGKEPGQGVGFLPDGTMVVVDKGNQRLGQEVQTEVTSVLQTRSGKMIFARLKEET